MSIEGMIAAIVVAGIISFSANIYIDSNEKIAKYEIDNTYEICEVK